jgi:hypothetical protein
MLEGRNVISIIGVAISHPRIVFSRKKKRMLYMPLGLQLG